VEEVVHWQGLKRNKPESRRTSSCAASEGLGRRWYSELEFKGKLPKLR